MDNVRVIMITFQGSRFFREQLDSIVSQEHLESIHIYDDASDKSFQNDLTIYAKQASVPIQIHLNATNLGVIKNIQQALSQHSDAPYIALADQDDLWYPGKLKSTLKALKDIDDPNIPCLVYHDMDIIDEQGQKQPFTFWESKRQAQYQHTFSTNMVSNVVTGSASIMNTAMSSFILDLPDDLPIYHDAWMGLVAFSMGKAIRINESFSAHRVHDKSLTFAKTPQAHLTEKFIRNWKQWTSKEKMFKEQFNVIKAFYALYQKQIPVNVKNHILEFLNLENKGFWEQKRFIHKVEKRIE